MCTTADIYKAIYSMQYIIITGDVGYDLLLQAMRISLFGSR